MKQNSRIFASNPSVTVNRVAGGPVDITPPKLAYVFFSLQSNRNRRSFERCRRWPTVSAQIGGGRWSAVKQGEIHFKHAVLILLV